MISLALVSPIAIEGSFADKFGIHLYRRPPTSKAEQLKVNKTRRSSMTSCCSVSEVNVKADTNEQKHPSFHFILCTTHLSGPRHPNRVNGR